MKKSIIFILGLFVFVACTNKSQVEESTTLSGLKKSNFETEIDGKQTHLFVLNNASGMEVCVTNYGGRIVSVMVPDKDGVMQDVVLGFDSVDDYINIPNNLGATIGRYGNRIAHGKLTVDGVEYELPKNNNGHTLHGGKGFDSKVFDAKQINDQTVELTYLSKDGEEGFPGNLSTKVTMTLTDDNAIDIQYEASTDKETVVNLTNHAYFNLTGNPQNTILDHLLTIHSDSFTPIDSTVMTTGEILTVEETEMDFRTPTLIGERIDNYENDQLKNADGYDHNWVLNTEGDISKISATVYSPETGIKLDVYTIEPGLQIYTGNFLDGSIIGKNEISYNKRTAICLETQKYPNAPNNPEWPSTYLKPEEKYTSRCIYKFSVKE